MLHPIRLQSDYRYVKRIPSRKRSHIPPNGKRNIIFKMPLKRGYVSSQVSHTKITRFSAVFFSGFLLTGSIGNCQGWNHHGESTGDASLPWPNVPLQKGTMWLVFGRVTHIYISSIGTYAFFHVCEASASSSSTLQIGWWMIWMSASLIHPDGPRGPGEVKHIHHSLRYGRTFEGEAAGLNSTALRKLPTNHQARTVVCHEFFVA